MKKVGKYLSLVLLLVLGLASIGLLLIFFVPNLTILNITAINYNKTISNKETYNKDDVNMIVLSSQHFDVKVFADERDTIEINAYANTLGFAFKNNSNFEIEEKLNDGVLYFTVHEPFGAAFTNNSSIKLFVPTETQLAYHIKNETSKVEIHSGVEIYNMAYETNRGNLTICNGASLHGEIDADINKGELNINAEAKVSNLNAQIALKDGKFNSLRPIRDVNLLALEYGEVKIAECYNFICNTATTQGNVKINKVNNKFEARTSDTNFELNDVHDAVVNITGKGGVSINNINGITDIETNSGDINIVKSTSTLNLKSNSGKITVREAHNKVYAQSNSGDVSILCEKDDDITYNGYVYVKMNGGRLITSGINHIEATLKGSAYAICVAEKLVGNNFITTENGQITFHSKVTTDNPFKLVTKTDGAVKVNLIQIPQYGGYTTNEETTTYVYCYETDTIDDSLILNSNSGSITMHDNNLVSYSIPTI